MQLHWAQYFGKRRLLELVEHLTQKERLPLKNRGTGKNKIAVVLVERIS